MLSEFDGRRRNNFTLMRLIFALMVLFGHSYPISGNGYDPLSSLMRDMWIGEMAVLGFFTISGFLISASFQNRPMGDFVAARILRLYPGFIVCLVVVALVLGPIDNTMSPGEYYSNPHVYWFIWENARIWDLYYNIPNHAPGNPFPGSTNGSTWTLPAELLCYVTVLFAGFFGALDTRLRANCAIAVLALVGWFSYEGVPVFGNYERFEHPGAAFLVGAAFWINRNRIPLHPLLAAAAVAAIFWTNGTAFWWPGYILASSYLVFFLAYWVPAFDMDRYGDFSYGIYIYAWPIQQLVWWPGQNGLTNAVCALPFVITLAVASWFLVERPALGLKGRLSALLANAGAFGPVSRATQGAAKP